MTATARAAALALCLAACARSRGSMLEGEIAQAIQTNPGHVDLAALYPAHWERMCILLPGTGPAEVDGLIGFHDAGVRALARRPDAVGLVFARPDQVAAELAFPRAQGDFAAAGRSYCLPRSDALFRADLLHPGPDGPPVVPVGRAPGA